MSEKAIEAARLLDMLPEAEQDFAFEFVKKLVRAWDPDFTRVTPQEAQELEEAVARGFIRVADIDWEHLSKYG